MNVSLLFALAIFAEPLPAQNTPDGADTETLIRQGLDAVQAHDQGAAYRAFSVARRKGGPSVYETIARAEEKIPGRDRRVLCWLAAYLADEPKAADAVEIKTKIDALDAATRKEVSDLLAALQDAVVQSPPGEARNYALRDMVSRWARFGDFAAANKVIDLIDAPNTRSDALANLASAYCQLIHAQTDRGDLKGAQASVTEAERAWKRVPNGKNFDAEYQVASCWIGLARGQVRAGDWKGAQQSLDTALKLNADLTSPGDTNNIWDNVGGVQVATARGQIKAGDVAGARLSIAAALQTADLLKNDPFHEEGSLLEDIAGAQLLAGDATGARDSLVRARGLARDGVMLGYVAVKQALVGDAAGSKATLGLIGDAGTRNRFQREIEHLRDEKPLLPPLPSDLVTISSVMNGESWMYLLNQGLDSPVFTAFPDYSDLKAVAVEILKEPVRNGVQPRTDLPLDRVRVLTLVAGQLLEVQGTIDSMLKLQFSSP